MRVPTQQDGSCTGRHSVFNVKLFTCLGSRAAPPGPGRRASPSRRCFAVPLPREEAPSHVSRSRSRVCLARRRRRQRNVTSTNNRGRTGRYGTFVVKEVRAYIHTQIPHPGSNFAHGGSSQRPLLPRKRRQPTVRFPSLRYTVPFQRTIAHSCAKL